MSGAYTWPDQEDVFDEKNDEEYGDDDAHYEWAERTVFPCPVTAHQMTRLLEEFSTATSASITFDNSAADLPVGVVTVNVDYSAVLYYRCFKCPTTANSNCIDGILFVFPSAHGPGDTSRTARRVAAAIRYHLKQYFMREVGRTARNYTAW